MARTANQQSSSSKSSKSTGSGWTNITVNAGPLGRLGGRAASLQLPENTTFTIGRPYGSERTLSLYIIDSDSRRVAEVWIPGLTLDQGPLAAAQAVREWGQLLDLTKVEERQ